MRENAIVGGGNSGDNGGNSNPGGVTGHPDGASGSLAWLGWTLVGGALVFGGGGGYMTVIANDYAATANNLDPALPDYDAQFDANLSSKSTWQSLSFVSYGLSALSLLAGLDILLGWPIPLGRQQPERLSWSLFPVAFPGGGGALLLELNIP